MTSVRLVLGLPPSVNHFKRGGADLRKSYEYATWRTASGWEARRQLGSTPPLKGDVAILVEIQRKGDIDNRNKPLLDFLQWMRVIENDNQVVDLHTRFAPIQGCIVTVTEIS